MKKTLLILLLSTKMIYSAEYCCILSCFFTKTSDASTQTETKTHDTEIQTEMFYEFKISIPVNSLDIETIHVQSPVEISLSDINNTIDQGQVINLYNSLYANIQYV